MITRVSVIFDMRPGTFAFNRDRYRGNVPARTSDSGRARARATFSGQLLCRFFFFFFCGLLEKGVSDAHQHAAVTTVEQLSPLTVAAARKNIEKSRGQISAIMNGKRRIVKFRMPFGEVFIRN